MGMGGKERWMNKKRIVVVTAVILIVLFIWGNSVLSRPISRQESKFVLELIRPLLELFVGKGHVTLHLVRKLAHITEFTALGFELGTLCVGKNRWYFRAIALGTVVAAVDEIIQIFSQRGAKVVDVGIDLIGVLLGIALCAVLIWLRDRYREKELGKTWKRS